MARAIENDGTREQKGWIFHPSQASVCSFTHSLTRSTDTDWVPATYQHWAGGTERTSPPSLRRLRPPIERHLMVCPPFSEVSVNNHPHPCPTHSHLTEAEREVFRPSTLTPGAAGPHTCPCHPVLLHFTSCAPFPSTGKGQGSSLGLARAPHPTPHGHHFLLARLLFPKTPTAQDCSASLATPLRPPSFNHLLNSTFARFPPLACFPFPVLLLCAELREQVLISGQLINHEPNICLRAHFYVIMFFHLGSNFRLKVSIS